MPQLEISALALLLCQIAVILLVCRLLGRAAAAIGQPQVIAEVTAGIVLGPSLLGLFWPQGMATLFPAASLDVLKMLSQIGLVLFMFLVGLEFDTRLLRGKAHASVIISHTSILVPFALGVGAAWWLHDGYGVSGVSWLAFALFMGVAMSVTAFPVLARILSERNLLHSRVGAIAIACAAVDDVTAWCLLAFVVAVARSSGIEQALWTTAFALAYIAVMVWLVRPFLGRLAARAESSDELPTTVVAIALLLLLISSAITEVIGIHALFGAFMFGAVLPKEGRLAERLADRLETVAVMMLLPLFFAYSGLRTEIGLISGATDWLVTGGIILIATLGKFGGSAIAARITGLRWREACAIGVLMNTRGLMELIVLNIALDLGVISPTLFTMLVLMALATTFATTPVLAWIYPDREFARDRPVGNVLRASGEAVALVPQCTVMIAVADAKAGPGLVTMASALLAQRDEPSRVFALHLRSSTGRPSVERKHHATDASNNPILAPLLARAGQLMMEVRSLSFVSIDPAEDIVRTAEAKQADILLLGAHKPLLLESQLGGTVSSVLANPPGITGVLIDRGLTDVRRVLMCRTDSTNDAAVDVVVARLAKSPHVQVTTASEGVSLTELERLAQDVDLVIVAAPDARAIDLSAVDLSALDLSAAARRFRAILGACKGSVLVIAGAAPVRAEPQPLVSRNTTDLPTENEIAVVAAATSTKFARP